MAKALRENWIAGAALDVYEKEPLPADSPLRDPAIEDRCRLYPHFASAGRITRLSVDPDKGMAGRTVQGLIDVLEGNYGGADAVERAVGAHRGQHAQRHADQHTQPERRRAAPRDRHALFQQIPYWPPGIAVGLAQVALQHAGDIVDILLVPRPVNTVLVPQLFIQLGMARMPIIACTGSPGARCPTMNVMNEMLNSTKSSCSTLRSRNCGIGRRGD